HKNPLTILGCLLLSACAAGGAPEPSAPRAASAAPTMADVLSYLRSRKKVDLTHAFGPGIPHWKGFDDETVETLYSHDKEGGGKKGTGFLAELYCHVGQWGTHVDPPVHFIKGNRTVDQIPPDEMILPLVVLDVHEQVE